MRWTKRKRTRRRRTWRKRKKRRQKKENIRQLGIVVHDCFLSTWEVNEGKL